MSWQVGTVSWAWGVAGGGQRGSWDPATHLSRTTMTIFSADAFFTTRWALSVLHPTQLRPSICRIWSPKCSPTRDAGVLAWTSCTKSPWGRQSPQSALPAHHEPRSLLQAAVCPLILPEPTGHWGCSSAQQIQATPFSWRGNTPGHTARKQRSQEFNPDWRQSQSLNYKASHTGIRGSRLPLSADSRPEARSL